MHQHNFDHRSFVASGEAHLICRAPVVDKDGKPIEGQWTVTKDRVIAAGEFVDVPKEAWHEFTATKVPFQVICCFATRNYDGEVAPFDGSRTFME